MELTTEKTLEKTSYRQIGVLGQTNKYKQSGAHYLKSYPNESGYGIK